MTEMAAANNPTDANVSVEALATPPAAAGSEAGNQPQPKPAESQTPPSPEKPAEGVQKPAEPSAPVVPEKYDFRAPDGKEFDPAILEPYAGAAREAGLSQETAQKLIENLAPAIAARQLDQVNAVQQEWINQSSSDVEFGGVNLRQNLAVARKAYDAFDPIPTGQTTTPLRTLMEQSGFGNHPDVIRFMFRAGKAISEDTFVAGNPSGSGKANATEVLYDKTAPQKG